MFKLRLIASDTVVVSADSLLLISPAMAAAATANCLCDFL
jgi:hypothetical protein